MPILTADNLSKSFGTRTLFQGVSLSIDEGEKVGFIGPNGSGKSTLFTILAGLEPADGGTVATRRDASVALLAQEPHFDAGLTIRTAVAAGNPDRQRAFADYAEATEALTARGDDAAVLQRQNRAMARIEALGGWDWQHRLEAILTRVGLDDWDRPVDRLSGGERKRVALARVLLDQPDLLFLDEPTNHLDADTTLWLEDQLIDYPGSVALITHDRYFLDRAVTRMIEVHPDHFASFDGGYSEYLEARAERAALQAAAAEKRDRHLEQELAWVKRSPSARTGKQKARINRLEAMRSEQRSETAGRELEMEFGKPPRLGRTVLEIDGLSHRFGDQTVIDDFSTTFRAGERIGIIGPNGAGKTTLLRILTGEIEPDAGEIRLGRNTRFAYFDQKRMDLDPSLSVYESISPEEWLMVGGRRIHARSYLERFLFPTHTHEQRVGSLSGGERNRLLLARLLLSEANLLLLDEPTNDLDLETLLTLESALVEFGGTALVVTHDRFFLDKVATGLLVFEGEGYIHRHEGGYDLYRRNREAALAEERKYVRKAPTPAASPPPSGRSRKLSYKESRELEGIEEAILAAEARHEELGTQLSDPALYVETPEKVGPLREALATAEAEVARLYARWEELDRIARGEAE